MRNSQFIKGISIKCHCHYGESTLTIHRTPHPQKGEHQISTADRPANTICKISYLNFIVFYMELPRIF